MDKTTVVIPASNEQAILSRILEGVLVCHPMLVIVLGDRFGDLPKRFSGKPVRFIEENEQTGNGKLVRLGFGMALNNGSDYIIKLDGDGQHLPEYVSNITGCLVKGDSFVLASRYHPRSKVLSQAPLDRVILQRMITREINLVTGWQLTDALSGFCGMSSEILRKVFPALTVDSYGLGLEFLLLLGKLGYQVREIPHPMIYAGTEKLDRIYQDSYLSIRAERAKIYLEVITRTLQKGKTKAVNPVDLFEVKEPAREIGNPSISQSIDNSSFDRSGFRLGI